ncbi:uncharacterized protein EI90DRAFT_3150162 [Cantharellus anzutake]|uniref:uncharacterized protein n=1 Tax=Cantharellus anzutake TaxID=1750568 RepID=UPI0019087A29|nr:uncharacterized protein EI90DRAFT_3150162 [Cantharellus anzutake]KAF8341991.1 hypothetical protein EI90DRAFT_3150162 [Cantharellus anzutake]
MVRIIKGALEDLFGGTFVGNVCSTFLFGILTVQVVLYYIRFPQDGKWIRRIVGFLWVAIVFQTVCMTKMIWWWHIQNYFNPQALAKPKWEFSSYHLATTIESVVVQSFFVYRIWGLSSNIYVIAPLQALVITQFAFATTLLIEADIALSFDEVAHKWNWLVRVWLAIQATCDALIAMLMTFLLWHRKTGFKRTDRAIDTMVYWSVATGSATCFQSIILMGIFSHFGFTFSALVFGITLSSMYPISMLTSLHMRSKVRKQLSAPSTSEPLKALRTKVVISRERGEFIALAPYQPSNLVVNIHRSQHKDSPRSNIDQLGRDQVCLSDAEASTLRNSNYSDVEFGSAK